jgi:signal transduction histidine kinase
MLNRKIYQILIIFIIFSVGGIYLSAQTIKVGLPLVPGILYRDNEGEPAGFYLDLLEAMAEEEDWSLEWIDGSWQESYQNLINGTIDMLPIAAITDERMEEVDFLDTTVITTWSELYIHKDSKLNSPLELNQKKIGLINSDNNSLKFTQFIQGFGVDYEPVVFENHEEAIKGLIEKRVFAFAGPSSLDKKSDLPIKNAGFHFNPVNSTMAFRKGFSPEIRSILNNKLRTWKYNSDSPYHTLLSQYHMNQEMTQELPPWLFWISYGVIILIITILAFNLTLRRKLRIQAKMILEAEREQHHSDKINSLGHMAGGIAHDFNNMLTGIMGFSELIMEHLESDELKEYSRQILETGQKASELTQQLLSFARKESAPKKETDIHDLLYTVKSLLQHTINPKISLSMKLDSHNPVLDCHSSQLQNALLNLGLNAVDAMPRGGNLLMGTRDLDLSKRDVTHLESNHVKGDIKFRPGKYLEIYFKDSGVGIEEENVRKIFEPYYTTKERGKGTGLGLPSVIGTVSLHEGLLLLQSKRGEGTTFRILLPPTP